MADGKKEKITKQFILSRLEDHEADLSACGISTFPAKELVSAVAPFGIILALLKA